jgi:CubicO group peptidase (beta-lactamase class C family)
MVPRTWLLAACLLVSTSARAAPLVPLPVQPEGVPWPTRAWPTGPIPAEVKRPPLDELLALVDHPHPQLGETRAVVIIHRGKLIVERYMNGYDRDTPLISWSMAKSITQALLGIAVRDGKVDIDKPMGNPRWTAGDPRAAIPWRQWINMVDGQDYHEIDATSPTSNDAARMLFGQGRLDVAGFAAGLPLVHPPGSHWNYNSAGINLIADGLGRVWAPGAAPAERRTKIFETLSNELFTPLGMTSAQPQFDAAGTFVGSALVYATARDFARFGYLYLRDGMWDGRRLLPPGWVDFARSRGPAPNSERYGAGWWIEAPGSPVPDLFSAQGHSGQVIGVSPSRDLVVVRLGLFDDRVGWQPLADWAHKLVGLFPVTAR